MPAIKVTPSSAVAVKLPPTPAQQASHGLSRFAPLDFLPLGDGTFRAVPRKPVELASVSVAAKLTGVQRDVIYRLYKAGFIEGTQASPRKITIFLATLYTHIEAAKDDEFWTPARQKRFNTGCRY